MEELYTQNTKLIMRRTQLEPDSLTKNGSAISAKAIQRQSMISQSQENIINEAFECIRDASSTENTRAIQDSESQVAQDQKRMIKTLVKKGWSKNEVIYEV
jgi:cytochrome c-type biogenesis protein CcmH/NrfF